MRPRFLPALLLVSCTWQTDLPGGASSIHVEPARELLVTDDAVLASVGSNASRAPLSFARAFSALPLGDEATLRWMRGWSFRLREEGRPDRADILDERVTCRWLRATPSNECDATCLACTGDELSLDAAPFRLIAIVNRTDLSVMPDRAADGGEGRLVYALTDGAADVPDSPPLPLTVIFEYGQQGTALEWEKRWHALGATNDEAFPAAVADTVSPFVAEGTLAQLRTADAFTGEDMVLHQFVMSRDYLVPSNVRNDPNWRAVNEADLEAYASSNEASIAAGTAVMPRAWWARSATLGEPVPAWLSRLPEGDALVRETCAGCHALTKSGFQLDPRASGAAKLSTFLSNPAADADELRRRVEWMQLTLAR